MEISRLISTSTDPPDQAVAVLSGRFKKQTYTVISKIAYLMGIPKNIFEHVHEPPKLRYYMELEQDKNARIARNLCRLRTAIIQNFAVINKSMLTDGSGIYTLPDHIPTECIDQLYMDGIKILKSNYTLIQYIVDLNRLISDRINNCREVFPLWLNWTYIREIFIMPNGLAEDGVTEAVKPYYENRKLYPYQVYLNWPPSDEGNIIFNDRKFVTLLYRWNRDEFTDLSKVQDVGDETMCGIYDFLQESGKAVIVVDCENSDPYKFCASLRSLDEAAIDKIAKIILYDDIHSASAWRILDTYIKAPIEHLMIERVKNNKSLVDICLTGGACREFYKNHADSFIIASSDSDYWGLISSLPEARFLVMVEREKCGPDIKAAFTNSGIFYCYLDDFNSGKSDDIRLNALIHEIYRHLNRSIHLNVNRMLEEAYLNTRANMSSAEKQQFYQKFIKPMHLVIEENGNVHIELQSN